MQGEMTPDLFSADYSGQPGARAFFLQARAEATTYSFTVEKQQVQVLAEKLHEMLIMIDKDDTISGATPVRDPALATEAQSPLWRVGSVAIAYDEASEDFLVVLEEMTEEDAPEDSGDSMRFKLRKDQVRAFVLHALAVVAEGRPTCQLCGLPMEPEGHVCPASNGHHATV